MEGIIESHHEVNSALIFGTGRARSGLLLEVQQPPNSKKEAARLRESIWPSIELANQSCSAQGVLSEGMIVFTNPQTPMVRARKGTVQRGSTLRLYEEEIGVSYHQRKTVGPRDDVSWHNFRSLCYPFTAVHNWTITLKEHNLYLERRIPSVRRLLLPKISRRQDRLPKER